MSSKSDFTKKFDQCSAKSAATPEPQATPNQQEQEPGRSYPRRFQPATREQIEHQIQQVRLSQEADRKWKAARDPNHPALKTVQ